MDAFSLVELLTVVAIIALLTVASTSALQALKSSGGINRAISEMSQSLEYARMYAMSNYTYVRVGIGQTDATTNLSVPVTVLIAIYSVDGTLDADSATNMADVSKWRPLFKPLIHDNMTLSESLRVVTTLPLAYYSNPKKTDIPQVSLRAGSLGSVVFDSFIQFGPNGEARVLKDSPARYIDIGIDRPGAQSGKNPFVLRLSGYTGNINVLRKGEGIE